MTDKDKSEKSNELKEEEILQEAKQHLKDADAFESTFRRKFVEDLKFVYDDDGQWEPKVKEARTGRPCYTFNRTEGAIDQVIGDQRQSRPSIKVRAAEDGDKKLAATYSGLIRNIEKNSHADTIYDHAFTFAVSAGYGVWRVLNEFTADNSFTQDIIIGEVANPLTVWFDPKATDICKRDGRRVLITDMMPKDEFHDTYPGLEAVHFTSDSPDGPDWYHEDDIRIAEFYRKVSKEKELLELSDGVIIFRDEVSNIMDEMAEKGITVKKSRMVKTNVIEWYKLFGDGILEGPIEYKWKYIPVVPVYGKRINIEGEYQIKGLTRNAKDPQRSYNYIRSVITEKALLAPKFNYILTPEQIKGYKTWWDSAHSSASPYILANPDPEVPGRMPIPAQPNPVPVELVTIAQMDAEDIKTATGKFDASLGAPSNETSGVAIRERKIEGDVGSFVYIDNLQKAIEYTGEILVDMIPSIYDTERTVRILGEDGAEDYAVLNEKPTEENGLESKGNDLSVGKYDVVVTTGPSYTTQRAETNETIASIGQAFPEIYALGADIFMKNLDIVGSEELEKRFRRKMIQQGTIEPTDEEKQEMQPEEPSEAEKLSLAKLAGEVQKLAAQVEELDAKSVSERAKAEESEIDAAVKIATFIRGDDEQDTQKTVRVD